jgi:hypothetical protein
MPKVRARAEVASRWRFLTPFTLALTGLAILLPVLIGGHPQKASVRNAAPAPLWSYGQYDDQMRGTTSYNAELKSEGVPLKLVLWNYPDGTSSAYFEAEESIDTCEFLIGEPIAAKFDDRGVENIPCHQAMSNSTRLYVDNVDDLIERIKKSKRLILEVEFSKGETRQFTLNVAGLKWPPPGSRGKPS